MNNTPYFERPLLFFSQGAFRRDLNDKNPITVFKNAINAASVQFNTRFHEGEEIRALIYERALFIDCILHYAWHQFQWDDDISLLAVGGYGRGELHPQSDIDLLILLKQESDHYTDSLERFLTLLWDIGLEIGHSVRTLEQCLEIASQDITVATNIMECRTLIGSDDLRQQLLASSGQDAIWPADQFFLAKREEQDARHAKHNNTEYNLEPNVKNAPGGLRDIQMVSWVAKRFFGVRTLKQLSGYGLFSEEEFAILNTGEEFLWKVRYGLHIIAGRPEERLLFDHQRELATLFGFKDDDNSLAVEQFMHRYYRIVLTIRELNEVFLQFLNEAIFKSGDDHRVTPINERFQLRDKFIEVSHTKVFQETPSALLEIFVLMGQNPEILGVRASTIRLIRAHNNLIDQDFRDQRQNQQLFLALMRSPYALVTQLKRMKRYGVLGRYLPEFGKITGQMQHDLFHIYTVDAHTILVIKNMRKFGYPGAEEKFPVAAHIMKRLNKPELLYIAGLYHDIAKGRGGDHSSLGAIDAADFCRRHGLSRSETNLVSWLVDKHLLMSSVSQKQDLSDPEVIHNFAREIGDLRHLDYLYALTVADINATNPDLWSTWRASLMRQLYLETKRALRRGLENPIDKQDIIKETQDLAIGKLLGKGFSEQEVRELWGDVGEDYYLRESHLDIAWHAETINEYWQQNTQEPLVAMRETVGQGHEGATQIFIYTEDTDHVFAAVATALDQLNLNIQDAKIYNSPSGKVLDTFYVLDHNGEPLGDNPERKQKIQQTVKDELALVDDYSDIIRRRTPRQLKHFAMPTRTSINNDIVSNYTVLEVISPDRPGLLARIGRLFLEFNIQLQNARVATLGERVEDVFFITDKSGNPLGDPQLCEQLQEAICTELDQQLETE